MGAKAIQLYKWCRRVGFRNHRWSTCPFLLANVSRNIMLITSLQQWYSTTLVPQFTATFPLLSCPTPKSKCLAGRRGTIDFKGKSEK